MKNKTVNKTRCLRMDQKKNDSEKKMELNFLKNSLILQNAFIFKKFSKQNHINVPFLLFYLVHGYLRVEKNMSSLC